MGRVIAFFLLIIVVSALFFINRIYKFSSILFWTLRVLTFVFMAFLGWFFLSFIQLNFNLIDILSVYLNLSESICPTLISMSLTIFSFSLTMRNVLIGRSNDKFYISMGTIVDYNSDWLLKSAWYIIIYTPFFEVFLFVFRNLMIKISISFYYYPVQASIALMFFYDMLAFICMLYYFVTTLHRIDYWKKIETVTHYLCYLLLLEKNYIKFGNNNDREKITVEKNELISYICSLTDNTSDFFANFSFFSEFSKVMNKIFLNNKEITKNINKTFVEIFILNTIKNLSIGNRASQINDEIKEYDLSKIKDDLINDVMNCYYHILSNIFDFFNNEMTDKDQIVLFFKNIIVMIFLL